MNVLAMKGSAYVQVSKIESWFVLAVVTCVGYIVIGHMIHWMINWKIKSSGFGKSDITSVPRWKRQGKYKKTKQMSLYTKKFGHCIRNR